MNATLTCPKCGAPMRSYERNRVHVDQCTGCGGLFLDRGELEALVAAETAWHTPSAGQPQHGVQDQAPPPGPQPYAGQPGYDAQPGYQQQPGYQTTQQPPYQQPGYQQPPVQPYGAAPYRAHSKAPRYKRSKEYGYGYGHRRKRSFLSELFDD